MTTPTASTGGAGRQTAGSAVEPATMSPEALATYLRDRVESDVTGHLVAYGQLTVTVAAAAVPRAVQLCRDDPRLGFDFFDFLTGVDEREDGFAVVIHLYSTRHRHHIQIRALADGGRDDPRLPTISHLYRGANWHEREAYDMFGLTFDGHPGLLPRILTVENFEGFPLRKEFLLMSREVKPWPGLKEPTEVQDDAAEDDGEGAKDTAAGGPSAEDKARMAREKAERAKAKAAEARKRKAQEQAEQVGGESGGQTEAAGGDVSDEKTAALAAGEGDDEIAGDPQQAAAIADDAGAKDAAAGAVGGDTAAGASSDEAGEEQPVEDPEAEAELASGADAQASGTPGVEAEGRHEGAEEQSGDQPAAETPEMASDTQEAEAGPPADELPEGDDGRDDRVDETFQGEDGGQGLPPRGPGEEEPRALTGDGIDVVPLAEDVDVEVTPTTAARRDLDRPIGTEADDRTRRLEEARGEADDGPVGGEPVGRIAQKTGRGAMPADRVFPPDEGPPRGGEGDQVNGATDETADDEPTADVDGDDVGDEQVTDANGDDVGDEQVTDANGDDADDEQVTDANGDDVGDEQVTDAIGDDADDEQVTDAGADDDPDGRTSDDDAHA